MSNRAGDYVATSASAKQRPVHGTAMIGRKLNNKNADMDFRAVPPPDYKAGGDSKREEPCETSVKHWREASLLSGKH